MPSNSTKILLLITLVGGVLVSVSSNSWLGALIGLEIYIYKSSHMWVMAAALCMLVQEQFVETLKGSLLIL